jgi:transposase-like protein
MRDPEQLKAKYALILRDREKHTDQTVDEFCRVHGIAPWTYYYWKRRLRQAPGPESTTLPVKKFLPIHVMRPPSPELRDFSPGCEIGFSNGMTMHFSGKMQLEDVSHIIRTVSSLHP